MTEPTRRDPLRIANCSGFFGDRVAAASEMVEGGPIDVLTGDWLAELTMYILHKTRERSGGYAAHVPARPGGRAPDLHRARHQRGVERGRAGPGRPGGRRGGAGAASGARGPRGRPVGRRHHAAPRRAAGERGALREPRHRRAPAGGGGRRDGQCLPAGTADRRCIGRRGPGGGHGPGHGRRAGRGTGVARIRVGGRRRRRHRRRRRGGARDRVRGAVLRRQLRVLRGDPGAGTDRLPAGRAARGRLVGHHEAPGYRRRGDRGHGDGTIVCTRSAAPAISAPMPWRASTRSSCQTRDRIGCASRASAARHRRPR